MAEQNPVYLQLIGKLEALHMNEEEAWVVADLMGWHNRDGSTSITSLCLKRVPGALSDTSNMSEERWVISRFISSTLRRLLGPERLEKLSFDLEWFTELGFTSEEMAWMCIQLDITNGQDRILWGTENIRYLPPERLFKHAASAMSRLIQLS